MSILRNINYMKNFVFFPCATPSPLIVIETAFEAALPELWEFFSFQIPQLLNPLAKKAGSEHAPKWYPAPARYRDVNRRSRGHGRHVEQDPPGRRSPGEKWGPNTLAFRMVDLEQKAMFWWMVVDLYTEFMARWTTLIYLHEGCPFDHQCSKSGPFSTIFIGRGENTAILPILSTGTIFSGGYEIQQVISPETGKTVDAGSFAVETKLEVFHGDHPPSAAHVEIRNNATGEAVARSNGGTPSPDGLSLSTGAAYAHPRGATGHSYSVVLVNEAEHEDVAITAGTLHISGGFCVTMAPALPFDTSHVLPRLAGSNISKRFGVPPGY